MFLLGTSRDTACKVFSMVANRKHLLNKFELYFVPQDKVNVFFGRGLGEGRGAGERCSKHKEMTSLNRLRLIEIKKKFSFQGKIT